MPLVQKNSGSISLSTSIATSLSGGTTAGNSIFIFIQSAATVATPSGFVSRAPQVNFTGFYLFDKLVASGNSTDTPTLTNGAAVNATWQIAEYSGVTATAGTPAGNNSTFQLNGSKATPNITPTAGDRLILAFVGAMASAGTSTFTSGQPDTWTNSFTGQNSILHTGSATSGDESFASGWADLLVSANGSTAYSTAATVDVNAGTLHPSTIIAAYDHTVSGGATLKLESRVLDSGLAAFNSECDKVYVCSQQPTSFAEATSTYALGNKNWGAGNAFATPAARSGGGRQVSSVAITDGNITANGTVAAWAAVDSVNSRLLASGPLTGGKAVTNGQVFTLGIPSG
jgi:hypothetical protein